MYDETRPRGAPFSDTARSLPRQEHATHHLFYARNERNLGISQLLRADFCRRVRLVRACCPVVPELSAEVCARLREAFLAAGYTADGVLGALGSEAHAALGRGE